MNHPTATIQPPLDLEAMWQNSLIRVSDHMTIPPVVLRVDEAIIGTLGNFSVSTGKAKASCAHQWTSARIPGVISRK